MFRTALALLLTFVAVDAALAQIIAPDPNAVTGTSIFGVARPYVLEILSIIITLIVGWAALLIQRWTGMEVEAKHREALQTTLRNAAALLVESVDKKVETLNFRTSDPKVAEAIRYVTNGAPDALKYFDLGPERIAKMLEAWAPQVESPPAPTPPVVEAPVAPPLPQSRR